MRKRMLSNYNISVKFLPTHNPCNNLSKRKKQEISKFLRIYGNITQRKWPELIQ
jgi:hypothetical protein